MNQPFDFLIPSFKWPQLKIHSVSPSRIFQYLYISSSSYNDDVWRSCTWYLQVLEPGKFFERCKPSRTGVMVMKMMLWATLIPRKGAIRKWYENAWTKKELKDIWKDRLEFRGVVEDRLPRDLSTIRFS